MYCKTITRAGGPATALAASTTHVANPLGPLIAALTLLLVFMMVWRYRRINVRRNK